MAKKSKKKSSAKRKKNASSSFEVARNPHELFNKSDVTYSLQELTEYFGAENVKPIPPELGTPPGSFIILQSKGSANSFPGTTYFEEFGNYIDAKDQYRAIEKIRKSIDKYDCYELLDREYVPLVERIVKHRAELPLPFIDEPLIGFTVRIMTDAAPRQIVSEVSFAPSSLKPIRVNSKETIYPMVDFIVNDDRTYSGCVFLSPFASVDTYGIGVYVFQQINKERQEYFLILAKSYFLVQYSFYVCPEHIVERANVVEEDQPIIASGDSSSNSNKSHGLNTVKVCRTYYIGTSARQKRGQTRHIDCWYQRGCMVHRKNGTTYFRKGCYKGPKRNDPDARKRTKRYITDKDIEKDCD